MDWKEEILTEREQNQFPLTKPNKMENEFVTYDIAVAMKELGFNEACMRMYKQGVKHLISTFDTPNAIYSADIKIQAPLYQQAFSWIYDNFKEVECVSEEFYRPLYILVNQKVKEDYIRNLIKIVKETNQNKTI
jgi:hypothetical protein